MAKYRSIQTGFWSDSKIIDDFTPEDRYFYLYLLTNEKSNQLGCYELSIKQACRDTGYNEETIKKLLNRFENILNVITYDYKTKEMFLKNWYKYNWLESNTTKKCIEKEFNSVKSEKLKELIIPLYAPYMPHGGNKKEKEKEKEKEIIKRNNNVDGVNNNIYNNVNTNTNTIYDFVKENFGRTLNPIEYEEISSWEDNELTRYAIKQSVLSNKCTIKYISRILNAYQRENIKTVQQAQEREREYMEAKNKTKKNYKTSTERMNEVFERFLADEEVE